MQAGLVRFGTDFGNGEADQRFFPRDATTPRYLAEKARVLAEQPTREAYSLEGPADEACVAAAQAWFSGALRREGHAAPASGAESTYAARNDACRSSQTGREPATILDAGTAWNDSRRSAA